MTRIIAKFYGKCASCGGSIKRGDEIEHEPKSASAWHLECFKDPLTQQDFDAEALADELGFLPKGAD